MTTSSGSPADLNGLVALAQREHLAGRLAEAAAVYRRILAIRPDIAEVQSDLGIILAQHGQLDEAAARFAQAIALKPNLHLAHYNLASVMSDLGRFDEAAAQLEHAIALRPDYPEAYNSLAFVQQSQGKCDQAVTSLMQAIAFRPNYAEAQNNLGRLFAMQNKFAEAAARFAQAVALCPGYAEARHNLACALLAGCTLDEAEVRLKHVLALVPDVAEIHNALGLILAQHGQLDQAAARFAQAIALKSNLPDSHAQTLRTGYADPHNNLGFVLMQQGRLVEAVEQFEQALALKPDYAEAHSNYANVLETQCKLDDAVSHYRQALSVNPHLAEAEMGLSACLLVQGDFERGWPAYEARLRLPGAHPLPQLPRWQGEPLAGRSLLLVCEECFGDTFQFVRYARLFKQRGARIVLAIKPALGRILASYPDVDELVPLGSAQPLPACDFYLPLLSAPAALRTDASTIPCEIPYLSADPELIERWRKELAQVEGFKIGVVWQAAHETRAYHWRSMPLANFAPLARLPGVQLISLQKGLGSDQTRNAGFSILDFSDRLDEAAGAFMDTAALIRNLDLVVSVDTSITHLAGALGAPVFVALPHNNEWRWQRDRDDSPWYPTVRIFRQTAFGQSSEVFERIANAIQARRAEAT